jgi:excisionase family DNA binding protein
MGAKTYSTGEAATRIGVSRQTLQSWIASGSVKAPKPVEVGRVTVRLWTDADIKRTRKFKGTLKAGRGKKKETTK